MQRFACEAHGAEQPWQTLLAAALFWFSSATIMAWPSALESLAVAAGFRAAWWLSTVARRFYYQLDVLS
jgi:hypothetical protein